ncbi:hypothetical protein [Amorphus sp. 3PC139-8]|uniref:plasmid mobilization protein n=1 Tax=Amorphus sp. 3PC139-8 TaxID=2735676 RepID=UPI00345D99AB
MARPPLKPEERRTEYLRVRLTPVEKRDLERAAQEVGVTMAEYARAMLTGKKPRAKPPRERAMTALLYELSSIATNLSQLADATGMTTYEDWAKYVGGQLVEAVSGRSDQTPVIDAHLEKINAAGHWVNALARRANMGKELDLQEVHDALIAVQKVLKPIHDAVSQPPPETGSPPDGSDAV